MNHISLVKITLSLDQIHANELITDVAIDSVFR